jgi:hypothetical protein
MCRAPGSHPFTVRTTASSTRDTKEAACKAALVHGPGDRDLAGLHIERRPVVPRHGDVVMVDPDLAERVVVGGLAAVFAPLRTEGKTAAASAQRPWTCRRRISARWGARCGSSPRGFSIQQR